MLIYFTPSGDIRTHFRDWVPRWLSLAVAMLVLIPILLINGTYTGSSVNISGYLGALSEDINMSYYVASAGMAIGYLFVPKIKATFTTKTVLVYVTFVQILLSFICASATSAELLIFCSLLIGFFKAFALIEVIGIIMPEFSPSHTRNEFYAKFYPITIGVGQISLYLTAQLAYHYEWQHMYYFMIVVLLISLLFVTVCMQSSKKLIKFSFKDIDWISAIQISIAFIAFIYVATYGKMKNWFDSWQIIGFGVIALVVGWMFIRRQLILEQPLADFSILKNRASRVSYLFSFVFMFFASFNTVTSVYVNNILKLDSVNANELYLYTLPGLLVGAVICYYWYLKAIRMAWLIFIGFVSFILAIAIVYFRIDSAGLYSDLFLPMFFKGVGMVVLFVAFGVYSVVGLPPQKLLTNAFFTIGSRSVLAPVISSSILANWLYYLQIESNMILSESLTVDNVIATAQYNQAYQQAILQGYGTYDASKIATNAIFTKIQIQATTVGIKEIMGWMLIMGIVLLIIILLYFFKFKPVKLIKVGNDLS